MTGILIQHFCPLLPSRSRPNPAAHALLLEAACRIGRRPQALRRALKRAACRSKKSAGLHRNLRVKVLTPQAHHDESARCSRRYRLKSTCKSHRVVQQRAVLPPGWVRATEQTALGSVFAALLEHIRTINHGVRLHPCSMVRYGMYSSSYSSRRSAATSAGCLVHRQGESSESKTSGVRWSGRSFSARFQPPQVVRSNYCERAWHDFLLAHARIRYARCHCFLLSAPYFALLLSLLRKVDERSLNLRKLSAGQLVPPSHQQPASGSCLIDVSETRPPDPQSTRIVGFASTATTQLRTLTIDVPVSSTLCVQIG